MNTPITVGRQTFDGLGRQLTVEAAHCITRFHYNEGQLPPTGNTLADGKHVAFSYEPSLGNALLSVYPQNEPAQDITRHPLGMPASSSGALGVEAFIYTPSGQPGRDSWTVDGTCHETRWHHSMNGLLQGFDDSNGVPHRRYFDAYGRVKQTHTGNIITRYTYDALSRPVSIEVNDPDSERTLTTSLTYDGMGREHTRTFTLAAVDSEARRVTQTFVQTLGYCAQDRVTSRTWHDGEQEGTETFEYDVRGRLVGHSADAFCAPQDPFGNTIINQAFTFNALNGYERVVTTYADGQIDEALFTYSEDNPVQLIKVTHTHPSWPGEITLAYDACGRVVSDSLGRTMRWNAQGRLIEVNHGGQNCGYGYTAQGRLTDRNMNGLLSRSFFSGEVLTHEVTDQDSVQFHAGEHGLLALSKLAEGVRQTTLLGTDAQGSIRLEVNGSARSRRYSAHGVEPHDENRCAFGFTGQRHEPLSGWQILGDYRPYDPVLMCFLSPDSESPFGAGGINPYAYCAGDPVNRIDPDGHSWVNYALAGAGIALSAIALIPGLQAALPAAGALFSAGSALTSAQIACLVAATLDVLSLTTGIASLALEITGNEGTAANILGGISLVTGLAGAGVGMKMHSLRHAGAQQRALDIKHGWKAPKPHRLGNSEVVFQGTSRAVDVGFIETYRGTQQAALLTHGDPMNPLLMGPNGSVVRAADIARDLIAPRLQAMNYPADEAFVLLSCWGGKNGAALEIAKELGRPVQGFMHKTYVKGFTNLQLAGNSANAPLEAIPYLQRLRATGNPLSAWKTSFRPARSKLFHPDGTITAI